MDDPDPADSIVSLPFTASLGPVGPLLRQLRSLTTPPEGASKREVRNLTKDLDVLCSSLMAHSQAEEPSSRVKSWMSEIRELCYDTKNYLDDAPFMLKQDDDAQLTPKDMIKIARLKFKTLKSRASHARKRRKRYQIDPQNISNAKFLSLGPRRLPVLHPELIDRGRMDILANMLGTAEEKPLKVVSLVGLEGVGKTTLAKRLYHQTGQQFQCGAFVKVSPNPDMRMLLTSIFTQIQLPGFSGGVSEPACSLDAQDLITDIRQYLQDKRYLIIMDDLWSISVWDIIRRAFPDDSHGSRIITTTQLEDVASACCSYQSKYIYQVKPLKVEQSKKLLSGMVFGSEDQGGCSEDFVSVSDVIISKCGRLPLLLANIASLLPTLNSREINLQQWEDIRDSLPSTLRRNPSSEGIKEVLNLIYNNLSPELKTCLLYLAMYPEGYTIKKDDLVKQWVAEGFTGEGQHKEEIARNYFDELVRRGMIQAVDIDYRGVLSCTLHRKVHELIVRKSVEGNFIIGVEYFQSSIWVPHKVRRLSVQFGGARSARIPAGITLSEVRSLAFFGFYGCADFIEKCKLLQQITLHVWADATYDLSGFSKLLPLRYLKIACNTAVKLPEDIQALQYLETLEVDATVQAIPSGIGGLSRLTSLKIAVRVLTRQDICILQAVPALAALSLHVSAVPAEMIVFDKGGFSLLEYLKFRSSVPLLKFEAGSMPGLRNLNLCFNAREAEQRRIVPIGIEHLSGLREITANIWGADTDVGSAFKTATSNHPSNPTIDVQWVDRIFHGEDAKNPPAGRMPTLLGSSSRVPVSGCHADEQNLPGELNNPEIVESLEAPYLFATQMEKQQLAIGHNSQDGEITVEVEPSSLDPPPLLATANPAACRTIQPQAGKVLDGEITLDVPLGTEPPLPATASPAASGTIQPQARKVQDDEITMDVELASLDTQPPPAAVTPAKGTIPAVEGNAAVDIAWLQPQPAAVTPTKVTIPAVEDMAVVDMAWLQPPPRAEIKSDELMLDLSKYILLLATVVATVTYAAGFSPPGGVWQDTDVASGRVAGESIIRTTSYRRFLVFYYCNATAFALSLVVNVLLLALLHKKKSEKKNHMVNVKTLQGIMVLDLLSVMGAYTAGTCRDKLTTVYSLALLGTSLAYLVVQMVRASYSSVKYFYSSDDGAIADQKRLRKVLMLLATFVVSVTYTARMSTPGGFWDAASGHRPGDAILNNSHRVRLTVFLYCNTTAFVASLLIIVVLLDRRPRVKLVYGCITIALFSLAVAYTAGSCRQTDTTVSVSSLLGLIFIIFFQVQVAQGWIEGVSCWNIMEEFYDTVSGRLRKATETNIGRRKTVHKASSLVLLLATLAATITYQAGLNPPGGVWPDNRDGHMAGDPILLTTKATRFKAFFYCNSIAFVASLVAIILVQNKLLLETHVLEGVLMLDLFGLMGAYAAGSSRDVSTSIYTMALAGAVPVYVVIHVVFFTLDHADTNTVKEITLVERRRKRLLLSAVLVATITYQVGLTPPGGFRLQDDVSSGHYAGDPVLLNNFPNHYKAFFNCNSVSFMLSISLIILLVNPNLYRPAIRSNALAICMAAGMLSLMGSYAAGSTQHLRTSIFIFVLIAVVLFVIAGLVMYTCKRIGNTDSPPKPENDHKVGKKRHAKRKNLMLVGILVASVTYQAGLSPPGGTWQSDSGWYSAGNPIMHDNRRARYLAFFYSNSTSFVASIAVIVLLLLRWGSKKEWPLKVINTTIFLDLLALLGAYAAGSSRKLKTSMYVVALIPVVLAFIAIHMLLASLCSRQLQSLGSERDAPQSQMQTNRGGHGQLVATPPLRISV